MTSVNTTTTPAGAIFSHEFTTFTEFKLFISNVVGRKTVRPSAVLVAPYYEVEYLNLPKGLVVLAHQDTVASQVDGIHPPEISKSIESDRNIVEPLRRLHRDAPAYNVHYMTRRSQGALVQEAFGRMVHGGSADAPSVSTEKSFRLEIYNTKLGPIIGAIESYDRVCVIRPNHVQVEKLISEVAA